MALVGYKLFFISVMKIRRNTLFVVYFMEFLVALSYSRGSCFAFVGFARFCTEGSFIPHICHEPTSEARVNFFWPV